MRILLFTSHIKTIGGGEKLIAEYAKRSRHDVDIYTLTYDPKSTFEDFEKLNVHELGLGSYDRFKDKFLIRGIIYTFGTALTKLPVDKYDAILVSSGGFSEMVTLKNRIPGSTFMYCHTPLRLANDPHDMAFSRMYASVKRRKYTLPITHKFYRIIQRFGWDKFDFVFFNSNLTRQRALDNNLIPERMSDVIYPGVDIPKTRNVAADNYLIYVSRFTTMKRQLELVEAYRKFLSVTGADIDLYLVGRIEDANYFMQITDLISKYKLQDRVHIHTAVPDEILHGEMLPKSLAGIFVGWREDFGIVPFEVMAHNKPLIATDTGGFTEIINGSAPSVVFFRDTIDRKLLIVRLADALIRFYNNMDEYIDKAKRNRKFVIEKELTWDRFTRDLDNYIEFLHSYNKTGW